MKIHWQDNVLSLSVIAALISTRIWGAYSLHLSEITKSVCCFMLHSYSIFGSIEVFNLNPDKVSEVHIWLMQDIGGPQR